MTEWKKYKLGDLVTFQRGHDLPKNKFINGPYMIAGSNGMIGYHNVFTTKGPGITIGRSGSLGVPYYYEKNFWAHNTTLYVKEFHNCDPKFIYYLLKTLDFTGHNSGSAVPSLNRNFIHPIEIAAPTDIKTQSRIASILSSLDDKIELNRRMNQTLEQMAQALFNHYFVDNIDPDNLPEGWRKRKVGDYIETVSKTHKFPNPTIIFLNTSDILEGKILHRDYRLVDELPGQAKKSIDINDILFSEIRPANKRFAFINFDANDYVVSTKLMVLRSKTDVDSLFFYFLLTRNEILSYLQNIAESRSGTFPQITFDQLKEIEFNFPGDDFLKSFTSKTLQPIYQMIFNNDKEVKTLSTIRDTLLPKLMSGEIDVDALMKEETIFHEQAIENFKTS